MNAKGFLGILNNLDMLTDDDLTRALGQAKASHLTAALRSQKLRKAALKLMTEQPSLMAVLQAGGQTLIGRVEKLAQDKDSSIARLAIQVMSLLPEGSTPAKKLKKGALHSLNPEVQSTVAEKKRALLALGALQSADAVNLVRHTAKTDRLKTVRSQAWITLASMGEKGRKQLIAEARQQARRQSSAPDSGLIKALGLITDDTVSDLLTSIKQNCWLEHRDGRAIVRALIEQETDRSFKCLADLVCKHRAGGRDDETKIICHLASQKRAAASRALLRIARKQGQWCDEDLINRLSRMPGRAVTRFLLEKAVSPGQKAGTAKAAEEALVSRRDKDVFIVLRDAAMTGSGKEARIAKRIIRKRGETAKFREHLLANL
jgi:hypothetical protein